MKIRACKLLFLLLLPSTLTLLSGEKRRGESLLPLCSKRRHSLPINNLVQAIKDNDTRCIRNTIATHPLHLRTTLLHAPDPYQERLPLELACAHGSRQAVLLLLEYGANPIISDRQGRTPLKTSIDRGSPRIVKLLLRHGAKATSPEGSSSPLGFSVYFQNKNACYYTIAKSLLLANADPNKRDHSGRSPYMQAAIKGYKKLLIHMEHYGADPLKISTQGKSALEYASSFRHRSIAFSIEKRISIGEEENIKNLLEEQPDDLITGETFPANQPSSLMVLNGRLLTKDFLAKHILHKIGTNGGPRDPFTNTPIPKEILVRLAAYTGIPYQEIDHTQQSPDNNSLVAIARRLIPRESVFSSMNNNNEDSEEIEEISISEDEDEEESDDDHNHYDRETYELIQGEIRLLQAHFSDRLRRFNRTLATSMYPPILPNIDMID